MQFQPQRKSSKELNTTEAANELTPEELGKVSAGAYNGFLKFGDSESSDGQHRSQLQQFPACDPVELALVDSRFHVVAREGTVYPQVGFMEQGKVTTDVKSGMTGVDTTRCKLPA